MAKRRCLSGNIVESDDFYRLPDGAQALYVHLNMISDDDGFINAAESVTARIKNGKKMLGLLVEKRFLLQFGSVYVVKHWRISNSLKNDRVRPLLYEEISKNVYIKQNKAYTDHPVEGCLTLYESRTGIAAGRNPNGIQMESNRNPNGIPTEPNSTKPNLTEPNLRSGEGDMSGFDEVWEAYPEGKRGNKKAAMEAYRQCGVEDASCMYTSLEAWKQSEQWTKDGGTYVPMLVNWLAKGIWQTMPEKMAMPKGASGQLGEAELEAIRRVLAAPAEDWEAG